jgi:Alw26I/Eco31I/Esp3I family type II restriction endonuclease
MKNIEEVIDRTWHKNFTEYTEFIVKHPNYKGLYYERANGGNVKWVITGKSEKGQLRREWWDEKCKKHGIKIEAGCYAKIAVIVHPTKQHVCQICGKSLSVEYVYPNKNSLKALNKLLGTNILSYSFSIFDIIDNFGNSENGLIAIRNAFKVEEEITNKTELGIFIFEHRQSRLSPGVMSNSPDRFDGFHSDGNCCRSKSDKGRHRDNLQRYSQDRRVYENWADGNWKMADRLMSEFYKYGVSPDHIGPMSLGFCHRAKFHPMTKGENASKNNRMSLADVKSLLLDEANGDIVISWHSKFLWDNLKNKITTNKEAVALSVLMRKNLHHVLTIFSIISEKGYDDFLMKQLNPHYSFYDYKFDGFDSLTGNYEKVTQKKLTGKNQQNNVDRYIRIAFESLNDYKSKKNRKQFSWNNTEIDNGVELVLKMLAEDKEEDALIKLKNTFKELADIASKQW